MPREAGHVVPTSDVALDLGTTAARWRAVYARDLQARGTPAGTEGTVQLFSQSDTARAQAEFWRARDNAGALEAVASGDSLGEVGFYGYDGAGYQQGAFIRAPTDGTIAAGRMPSRIEFGTAPDSVSAPTARWRLMPSGILQPAADNTYDIGQTSPRVRALYAYTLDAATAIQAGSDSAVDIGATATRFRHVYSDQWVAAAPATGINIASVTDVNLASKSIEGIAAGDSIFVEAMFVITNNSGGGRIYVVTLELGSATFDLEMTTQAVGVGASSSLLRPVHVRGAFGIVSTSSALAQAWMELPDASSTSGAKQQVAGGTNIQGIMVHGTSAANLTGTQTCALTIRSASATATQTATLTMFRVERVRA